jgi:diguanylate cyclase (GGDEF)-like protein/PAS domain S-box-containing protein
MLVLSFLLQYIIFLIGAVGVMHVVFEHYHIEGFWVNIFSVLIVISILSVIFIERMISFKKQKHFIENKNRYDLLFNNMTQGFALHKIITDKKGKPIDYKYIDVNPAFEKLTGLKAEDIVGKNVKKVLPNTEQYWIDAYGEVALTGKSSHFENFSSEINKYFEIWAFSPQKGQFAVVFLDVTKRKIIEKKLEYHYFHDETTGIYNRNFIDEKIIGESFNKQIPISVLICNINGMKMKNEMCGRALGDKIIKKTAKIIQQEAKDSDFFARWGGDEFIIILPNTTKQEAEKRAERIKTKCKNDKSLETSFSVSFGIATKTHEDEDIESIIFKAEDLMLKDKVYEISSFRGQAINMILKTLHEKNIREEQHSRRVSEICVAIGRAMKFNDSDINKLRVIGLVHDIGKIGINENLLNKEGLLTQEEWGEMKKHSEIGYRILSSTNKTSELAEHVLNHHERLDAKGYPNKVGAEKISVFTRILSIADAFDAMISKRTYRDSLSIESAEKELIRNSGTQFDKDIVDVFIKSVLHNHITIFNEDFDKSEFSV